MAKTLHHVVERGIQVQVLNLQLLFVMLEQCVLVRKLGVLRFQLLVTLLQDFVVAPKLAFDFALGLGVDERGSDGGQHYQHGGAGHRERQPTCCS